MIKWSRYVQSPRLLEISRKYYFSAPDTYPLIRRYLGVAGEMRILDVGCGAGFYPAAGFSGETVLSAKRRTQICFYKRTPVPLGQDQGSPRHAQQVHRLCPDNGTGELAGNPGPSLLPVPPGLPGDQGRR